MKLAHARNKIRRHIIKITKSLIEDVSLYHAVGRICAETLHCPRPLPHFSYSLMDGYAMGADPANKADQSYKIIAEIAAGCTEIPPVKTGEAVRIMTGAAVPAGAERVVPFELCHEHDGLVKVSHPLPPKPFIRWRGSDMAKEAVIIKRNRPITLDHLEALAAGGYDTVPVFQKPEIRFFCTGSELVNIDTTPEVGQRISSNPYILSALIQRAGGIPVDLGIVSDTPEALRKMLAKCLDESEGARIIISTGGMGPGKYDLTAAIFQEMGGKVIYDRLEIKSGSTLFGCLGNILYFALPGPPAAVVRLFTDLGFTDLRARAAGLRARAAGLRARAADLRARHANSRARHAVPLLEK